jgi:hypothetical protein
LGEPLLALLDALECKSATSMAKGHVQAEQSSNVTQGWVLGLFTPGNILLGTTILMLYFTPCHWLVKFIHCAVKFIHWHELYLMLLLFVKVPDAS